MLMQGRKFSGDSKYRYGFNGKENDNDVKGDGNQQDYGMRVYDGRIGKFLSVDPLQRDYPELTTYQFASNTPIQAIDLDGLEMSYYTLIRPDQGKPYLKFEKNTDFTETKTSWTPTWDNWTKTTSTITRNPRHEYVVKGTVIVTYGLDGTQSQVAPATWTFSSEVDMRKAENHGGPGNYGGWSWASADKSLQRALFISANNMLQAEAETPGGLAGLGSKYSKTSTPATKTNNITTAANSGNAEAANANNAANLR
ncbi:RHS repeat-associated core domain-containing protein [Ferruginibacter sp. HRS2-29]|uniref:RHS repeat-associated core domain-containing protein n=1 Tax=Ferruginibacter sp. HRS2-29 TaxID=2487334 RepID=UPI0020CC8219|nr:RHS repeat-associated core domain-containing protein [Ferruginibacter sp. HRS2-29]MCP9752447.1 hypothetical protein [Ferruginibacter sp. HRS2-29]